MVRVLKAEGEALREVLASEWDSEDDLIKALMDKFFELLENRDLYGVRWGGLAYGPFTAKPSAQKLCKALGDVAIVAPLLAVGKLRTVAAQANPEADSHHCPACSHPKFAHNFVVDDGTRVDGCVVKRCDCTEVYSRKAWEKR